MNPIATHLHFKAKQLLSTHPAIQSHYSKWTATNVRRHLGAIGLLVSHSPRHLLLAENRARLLSLDELADFIQYKRSEESGHDLWAKSDLRTPSCPNPDLQVFSTPALESFLEWIYRSAESSLSLYLGYVYSVEQITVLLGPAFLSLAEKTAGIRAEKATIISNHVELDSEHAQEMLHWIDWLKTWGGPEYSENDLIAAADRCMSFLDQLLKEIFLNEHPRQPAPIHSDIHPELALR